MGPGVAAGITTDHNDSARDRWSAACRVTTIAPCDGNPCRVTAVVPCDGSPCSGRAEGSGERVRGDAPLRTHAAAPRGYPPWLRCAHRKFPRRYPWLTGNFRTPLGHTPPILPPAGVRRAGMCRCARSCEDVERADGTAASAMPVASAMRAASDVRAASEVRAPACRVCRLLALRPRTSDCSGRRTTRGSPAGGRAGGVPERRLETARCRTEGARARASEEAQGCADELPRRQLPRLFRQATARTLRARHVPLRLNVVHERSGHGTVA